MTDLELGALIRQFRKQKGYSQQELATKLGVTWEMVSRYERGRSSAMLKLLDLAVVLEVSPNAFFTDVESTTRLAEKQQEYMSEHFLPVVTFVPSSLKELAKLVNTTEEAGKTVSNNYDNQKFLVKLGDESKLRITVGSILPKGFLVCTLDVSDIGDGSIVLAVRNGLVSVEIFAEGVEALAKVVQWVVKF